MLSDTIINNHSPIEFETRNFPDLASGIHHVHHLPILQNNISILHEFKSG